MVPAAGITKWVKLGFTGASAALALAAVAPHMAGAATADVAPAGPEATAPAGPEGASTDAIAKGRELFNNWSCGTCHALKDADASGHVGPALDGNPNLTEAFVVDRVTNGQGPMPAFGGQLSEEEIAELAAYIHQVAIK